MSCPKCDAAERRAADLQRWKDAVIDQLVVCEIYRKEHEDQPAQALAELLGWHTKVALDPAVSEGARRLRDQERRRAAKLEAQNTGLLRAVELLRGIDISYQNTLDAHTGEDCDVCEFLRDVGADHV